MMNKITEQNSYDRVRQCWHDLNVSVRLALSVLRSSDFGEQGLNETGFKAMVIACLLPLLKRGEEQESVHSEPKLEGGYADLIVRFPKHDSALVIELKYLQLLYFEHVPWKQIKDEYANKKRVTLTREAAAFEASNVNKIKEMKYRNPKTKKYDITPFDVCKAALEQAKDYAVSLRDGALVPFDTRPKRLYYAQMVGCVAVQLHKMNVL